MWGEVMGTGVRMMGNPTLARPQEPTAADQLLTLMEVVRDPTKYTAMLEHLKKREDELQAGWQKLDEERLVHQRQMQADTAKLGDARKALTAEERRVRTDRAAVDKDSAFQAAERERLKQRQSAFDAMVKDHDDKMKEREATLKTTVDTVSGQERQVRQLQASLQKRTTDLDRREQEIATKEREIAARLAQLNEASAAVARALGR